MKPTEKINPTDRQAKAREKWESLIEKIKEKKIKLGVSSYELAKRTGISQSGLSLMLNGKRTPNIEMVFMVCEELKIKI